MNNVLTFFVGCFTFLVVMVLKIPIKRLTWRLADRKGDSDETVYIRYRRYNLSIIFLVLAIAVTSYWSLYRLVGLDHFKLCCTLKAGAMAMAIYAVDEQWTGGKGPRKRKKRNAV